MRLFEGEERAASITACAAGPSFTTQASNFSLRRRSAALPSTITDSMPNWRKHSVRIFLLSSWRSIMAMRATAFLGGATAARAVPWALSITKAAKSSCEPILAWEARFGKDSFGKWTVQKCYYKRGRTVTEESCEPERRGMPTYAWETGL